MLNFDVEQIPDIQSGAVNLAEGLDRTIGDLLDGGKKP